MPQIFHKALNPISKLIILGLPIMAGGTGLGLAAFYRSSYATGEGQVVTQPVAFSHMHHVGQLGIDCRYCHTTVESSGFANIPPTKTCVNCHQEMWLGANLLKPVRDSWRTKDLPVQESIKWNRVHNVPHYAYFNHSIHIAKGVGCISCHGHIDEMPLTFQSKTLLMEWCIACHREPEKNLRPKSEVFSMTWTPEKGAIDPETGKEYPKNQSELGKVLKAEHKIRDPLTMTNCSMCHR